MQDPLLRDPRPGLGVPSVGFDHASWAHVVPAGDANTMGRVARSTAVVSRHGDRMPRTRTVWTSSIPNTVMMASR